MEPFLSKLVVLFLTNSLSISHSFFHRAVHYGPGVKDHEILAFLQKGFPISSKTAVSDLTSFMKINTLRMGLQHFEDGTTKINNNLELSYKTSKNDIAKLCLII